MIYLTYLTLVNCKNDNCPIENEKYELILEKCYFFEKSWANFSTAQDNCTKIFAPGKIFEPTTIEIFREVYARASIILNKDITGNEWILTGFIKDSKTGQIQRSSDNTHVLKGNTAKVK